MDGASATGTTSRRGAVLFAVGLLGTFGIVVGAQLGGGDLAIRARAIKASARYCTDHPSPVALR